MNTRIGQYLSHHPFIALTVLVFSTMAAFPVGLFLIFTLVTIIVAAVGFVCFEAIMLSVAGLTLLCVLPGLVLLSVLVSVIFNACYSATSSMYNCYTQRMVIISTLYYNVSVLQAYIYITITNFSVLLSYQERKA
ncbi:hypothetical protein LDENG_00107620 [Lucifuga dentata]|nr:hypothetical protein LDENG_00107620 [Lucifuga dentata]